MNKLEKHRGGLKKTSSGALDRVRIVPAISSFRVVGPSAISLMALSLVVSLAIGFKGYQAYQEEKIQKQILTEKVAMLENSLSQQRSIIESQDEVIERIQKEKAAAKSPSVNVVNNINIPSMTDRSSVKPKVSSSRRKVKLSPAMFAIQQPFEEYLQKINPDRAIDAADLRHQIFVQKNRLKRHQAADRDKFKERYDLLDNKLAYDQLWEKQRADSNRLNRMFDKIYYKYLEDQRVKRTVSYTR